jgi:valyl-tRNA synthetase
LIVAHYAQSRTYDEEVLSDFDKLTEVIAAIRNFKANQEIKPSQSIDLQVHAEDPDFYRRYQPIIQQAAVVNEIASVDAITDNQQTAMVGKDQLQFQAEDAMDVEAQLKELEEEKAYNENFLAGVEKKLSNEGFINNAKPEVVEKERQKKQDAEEKIQKLKASIERLKATKSQEM